MRRITIITAVIVAALFTSCQSDPSIDEDITTSPPTTEEEEEESTDDYQANLLTDEYLLEYYLYNEEYAQTTRDYTLDYESMLYTTLLSMSDNVLDKRPYIYDSTYYTLFSYISRTESATTLRSTSSRATMEFGFASLGYAIYDNDVTLCVNAVYNDSPASRAGITRGYIISHINGFSISQLYMLGSTLPTSLLYPVDSQEVSLQFINSDETISLTAESMEASPILYSQMVVDDVAYLNLARFDYQYNSEMLDSLASLKEQGCEELILDLRINPGGYVMAANVLTTSLAATDSNTPFCYYQFNDKFTQNHEINNTIFGLHFNSSNDLYYDTYSSLVSEENRLGLSRVYCLVSYSTASASEMVINSLRGEGVEVVLIGADTRGKNVGSYEFSYSDDTYDYTLSPIMFEVFNNNLEGGYEAGFTVDEEVNDYTYFCDFGSSDPMIAKALELLGYHVRSGVESSQLSLTPQGEQLRNPHYAEGAILGGDKL